jgi:hypothetical protein
MSPRREVTMTYTMMEAGKLVEHEYTTTVFDHIAETKGEIYSPIGHAATAPVFERPMKEPTPAKRVPAKAEYLLAFVAARVTKVAEVVHRVPADYRYSTEVGLYLIDGKPSDPKVKRAMAGTAR